jgi:hypothetical protein
MCKSGYAILILLLTSLAGSAAAGSIDTLFDVLNDNIVCSGPPYPTAAYEVALAHRTFEASERDGKLSLGIGEAVDGLQALVPLDLETGSAAQPPGDYSTASRFDVFHAGETDGVVYPQQSRIAAFLRFLSEDGLPAELVILRPELSISDRRRFFRVSSDESSFQVICSPEFVSGSGHELVLQGQLAEGLELYGLEVALLEGTLPEKTSQMRACSRPWIEDSFFRDSAAAAFDVRIDIARVAEIDASQPVLSLELVGQFLGAPSPVENAAWSVIKDIFRD